MGEVYLARDSKLDRKVALKILPSELAANQDRMRRFVQEAKAASALNHPNILTIYEIDETDSGHFIATEFIDGETLRERLRREHLKLIDVLDVATQIASALVAAHAAGIVHRDIKPENLMLRSDGIVKVLDFGLAKLSEAPALADGSDLESEALTRANYQTEPGRVMGTVAYMSPEQARGMELDARTDIWSLGVVLYRMITGRVPFKGETSSHVAVSILEHEPPPLTRLAPDVPAELQRIVRKCLTKKRDDRYQTARDLLIDLKSLRREVEFQSEFERSVAPYGTSAPPQTVDSHSNTLSKAINAAAATGESVTRETSSVESAGHTIKRHKKSILFIVALAAIAVMAWMLFVPSRSARNLTEKDTILLTDFVNTTGDSVFDGTLKQALAVQLGQSPFLNIFSEDRAREALKLMGRSPDERMTRDVGREICQRQGLKAFLSGSISALGSHYVVTIEATNAQTGDTIASQQAEAESKEEVLTALGGAATKLREKLGESLASIQKYDAPIYQATTSSLDALKVYSMGVEQQLNGKYLAAIPLFKRATDMDANFARAWAAMSSMYFNTRQYDQAAEASRKAYELRDRVGENERLYITQAYYDNVTGELDNYLQTLEIWKRTYPRDATPHNNLAVKYNDLGQFDKAADEAREAIRLNPNSASGYSLLAGAFVGLNRFDEAKDIIAQARAKKLETTAMHRAVYRIAFVQNDVATMKQEIDWANGKPEEYAAQTWQADSAAFSGQLQKAKEFSSKAFELTQGRDLKEVAAQIAAGAALRDAQYGECGSVNNQVTKALELSHDRLTLSSAANALAICGDAGKTKALTDELGKRFPADTLITQERLPLIQAHLALKTGDSSQALKLLEPTGPYGGSLLFPIAYLRGQAYLAERRPAEAAAAFQEILAHRGWSAVSYFYPLAYVGLARATALQNDTAAARKAYQNFFALWKDADPDIPILQQAKDEYEKLK